MSERFGLKIGIEGEKEFKKALADINQSFKVLGSEMKLVDSEFDKNDKSVQALTARNDALNKEIDAQKDKIKVLRDALTNAAESFGEADKRTQNWRIRLNEAHAALNVMNREFNANGQAIQDMVNYQEDSADATEQFTKELSRQNDQMKVLGSEMKLVASQFDKNDSSVEALTAKNSVLTKEIETQREKVETLRAALQNSAESFGENDSRTQSWRAQLNNAQAELNGMERELSKNEKAINEVNEGMEDAEDATDKFGKELDDTGNKADGAGGKLEKLGSIAKGIGVAFTAAIAAVGAGATVAAGKLNDCIDVYSSFDDSMKQVAATMGMTAEEIANGSEDYAKLEKAAKDAGASTRYTASDAASALNYLALAGYDAEKAVATMPKVLNLAAAGGMDLATASDMVTDSMSALGMSTEDLDKFMDQMAKTSQKANTNVQQLGEATLVCAGVVSTTGQDLTTMNTALGVLADNGIKGGEGGTHLRNVLLSLSAPTDVASAAIKELGLSIYDAEGNMRDIDDIMTDMNASLSNLSGEERTNIINAIFNKTDIAAVNALLGATSGRFDELSGLIEDSAGAAQAMADTMESGLAGTERSFKSAVEGMQIEVGDLFAGFKQTLMSDTTSIIRDFTNGLADADGDWNKIGEVIGLALSNIITLVGSYLPQIMDVGITILSTLGNSLMSNLDVLTSTASGIVMTLLNSVISALPALFEAATQIILTLATGLGEALPTLVPTIVEVITTIVQNLIDNLPKILEAALQIITGLADGLLAAIPVLVAALPDIIKSIVDFIIKAIPQIVEAGIQLLTSLVGALPEIIESIVAALPKIIDEIVKVTLSLTPLIIQAGMDLLVSLIQNLPTIITTISTAIPQIVLSIVDALVGNIDKIIMAGVQLFTALIENLPTIIVEIVKAVPQIISGIVDAFGKNMGRIVEIGGNIVKGLWEGIQGLADWLWDSVSGWISGIWDGICDFFGIHSPSREMAWIGEMLVKGLAGSIDDNGGQAVKAAEGMAEDINGVMRGLNDDLQSGLSSDFKIDTSGINPSANVNSAVSGGGPLFTVGQMIVRSDDDIRKVSQELYNLLQINSRARGRTVTA